MRAIVIGGGFAGLSAAQALASRGATVTVIERDAVLGAIRRRGVPQSGQLHNILGRAQLHLDVLFPGWRELLEAHGCGVGRVALDTDVHEFGRRMPRRDLGFDILSAPRGTIDAVLAELVNAEILTSTKVTAPMFAGDRCTGLIVEGEAAGRSLDADLVVDCSGPAALSAGWLGRTGRPVPVIETKVDQWYVSTQVVPDTVDDLAPFLMAFPTPPEITVGALMSPTGDGSYTLSVNGRSHDPIPKSVADVGRLLEAIGAREIAARLAGGRAGGPLSAFHRTVSSWHRFDHVTGIEGLIALGDSVATLNPLFGQGMSVAAWQAARLAELAWSGDSWQATFERSVADIVERARSLGSVVEEAIMGVDAHGVAGERSAALATLIAADPEIHRRYVRTWHLLEHAAWLTGPEFQQALLTGDQVAAS